MTSQNKKSTAVGVALNGFVRLDEEEVGLLEELRDYAMKCQDWADYRNHYIARVSEFYALRGLSRQQIVQTVVWRIAQQFGSELQYRLGDVEALDYRDELEELIRAGFASRREFCQATGLSEDMLSHVLAKRKDFSMQTLSEALGKVGIGIHLAPVTPFAGN
jgi:hypothetical protein